MTVGLLVPTVAFCDDYDEFSTKIQQSYLSFKEKAESDYQDFREKVNKEYEEFLRKPWTPVELNPLIPTPTEPSPAPVIVTEDVSPVEPMPLIIKNILNNTPVSPQPQPVSPIQEDPFVFLPTKNINIILYGTQMSVRCADLEDFKLLGNDRNSIAYGWNTLCNKNLNNLLNDCLCNRDQFRLSDWAYLTYLQKLTDNLVQGQNERALIIGFLLNQSGYKMRFALDNAGTLHVLYAVSGYIFNTDFFYIDEQCFYPLTKPNGAVRFCDFSFPQEKSIYMGMREPMLLNFAPSSKRKIEVHSYPGVFLEVTPNKNLIDYFNDLPDCSPTREAYSKWALYANAPASPELRHDLYPTLTEFIQGKSQADAANFLIKVAQSFPYGYDDKIWGYDRAFFPDESWNYPESDCEDHAIHFSRLVRDLMNLEVALLYYPGHIATAVAFTDDSVTGDYINQNGKKWIVCDPSIFYSKIGRTMKGMDNNCCVFIHLEK